MDDTAPLFWKLQEDYFVDIYESLAIIVLFCNEDFIEKCSFLF